MEGTYPASCEEAEVIICYCSDSRFQEAIITYILKILGLVYGKFFPVVLRGGPTPLAYPKKKPKDFSSLFNDQILFFLKHAPKVKKIILIGHEDCKYYQTFPFTNRVDRDKEDLVRAVKNLGILLPSMPVEAYYVRFADGNPAETIFERIV